MTEPEDLSAASPRFGAVGWTFVAFVLSRGPVAAIEHLVTSTDNRKTERIGWTRRT